MSYLVVVAITVGIYMLLTLSLNVITGYAGQPHLGQAAFFGIGAYTAAVLSTKAGLSFWLDLPAAIVVTAAVGALLGVISLRLRADFFAITTIGINFVVTAVFLYWKFLGGAMGIDRIPVPTLFGWTFDRSAYLLTLIVVLAVAVGLSVYLERSWLGLGWRSIRDDEAAAASVGIDVARFKILAFVLGTGMAGAEGSFYAHYMGVVTVSSFSFSESITILAMLIFGGLGTIRGALAGAFVLGVAPEALRFISEYRLLVHGALLIVMVRFQPQGLLGPGSWLMRRLRRYPGRGDRHVPA